MSNYAKENLAIYLAFKDFHHIFLENSKTSHHHDTQQISGTISSSQMDSTTFVERMKFCPTFSFTIALFPGKLKTAADFLSRSGSDPNEKNNILEIREDVPAQPIEVNNGSTGIAQRAQIFFQTDDAELSSEEQLSQRKPKNTMQYTDNRPP